jgi:tetratricopeptide (TPR) repeat protein
LIGVYLSYRAVKAWDRMINLYKRMPAAVKRNVMVREQLGLALNRSGRRQDALKVLEAVIKEQGPSAETYGLIGRVYKDLWADARKAANKAAAKGFLDRAIDAYVQGFETDWRDVYPGVNAVTLLHVKGDKGSLQRKAELLPVVRFAALQRLKGPEPDYWDYATLLEVAVLDGDRKAAKQRLAEAVVRIREIWEPETTVNNLNLIREAGRARGVKEAWLDTLIKSLAAAKPQ